MQQHPFNCSNKVDQLFNTDSSMALLALQNLLTTGFWGLPEDKVVRYTLEAHATMLLPEMETCLKRGGTVAQYISIALGLSQNEDAVAALINSAMTGDRGVSLQSLKSLGQIGGNEATYYLLTASKEILKSETTVYFSSIANALALLNSIECAELLEKLFYFIDDTAEIEDAKLKTKTVCALGLARLGDNTGYQYVCQSLRGILGLKSHSMMLKCIVEAAPDFIGLIPILCELLVYGPYTYMNGIFDALQILTGVILPWQPMPKKDEFFNAKEAADVACSMLTNEIELHTGRERFHALLLLGLLGKTEAIDALVSEVNSDNLGMAKWARHTLIYSSLSRVAEVKNIFTRKLNRTDAYSISVADIEIEAVQAMNGNEMSQEACIQFLESVATLHCSLLSNAFLSRNDENIKKKRNLMLLSLLPLQGLVISALSANMVEQNPSLIEFLLHTSRRDIRFQCLSALKSIGPQVHNQSVMQGWTFKTLYNPQFQLY